MPAVHGPVLGPASPTGVHGGFLPTLQPPVCFIYLETPPDALILESPFTNIREEAKSHPFSVASTDLFKN